MTVGSRSSPGSAVGSKAGTEELWDRAGPDEFLEGFFVDDDLGPKSAESLVDLRTRFFRDWAGGCEMSTSEDISRGPISPERPGRVRVSAINEFGCSIGSGRLGVSYAHLLGSREGTMFAPYLEPFSRCLLTTTTRNGRTPRWIQARLGAGAGRLSSVKECSG